MLGGIDLDIREGTIFSLLGPNGAGKTTTARILSTLSKPDADRAWIAGKKLAREPDAVRAAMGVTGQSVAEDSLLTGFENLVLMGKLYHLGKRESQQRARNCCRNSNWSRWPANRRPPTPAACVAGWIWP